jgi:hypothetical protein
LYESVHAVSGRQTTVPDTGTAAWPLESSLVAWYARPATICTAALSWRSVRGRCRFGRVRGRRQLAGDTQNVDISWYKHAGGAGKLLQSAWCCILPSAHPPSSTAPPRHRMELQIAGRERPPRTRRFEFLKKLFDTAGALAARARRSRSFCAATQCASSKCCFPTFTFNPAGQPCTYNLHDVVRSARRRTRKCRDRMPMVASGSAR